jgi:copper transport protein
VRVKRAATVLSLAVALLFGARSIAFAHATLVRSEPAADSHLATSPSRVRLVFSEALEITLVKLSIVRSDGSVIPLSATGDPHDVNAVIAPVNDLATGAYRLQWRVVSADGHPVEGTFSFFVGAGSAGEKVPVAAFEVPAVWGPSFGEAPLIPAVLRGLALGALMALAGMLLFMSWPRKVVLVPSRAAQRLVTILSVAAPLLLAVHLAAWAVNADPDHHLTSASVSAALASGVGRVELWRVGLALLSLWALVLVRRERLAVSFALAALLVSGASGHAAAIQPLLAAPAKALHLVAGAAWVGGLLWLVCLRAGPSVASLTRDDHSSEPASLTRDDNSSEPASLTRDDNTSEAKRVSSVALAAVIVVTLSGIIQTVLFLPALSDLFHSTYGAIVLAKVCGMLTLVAFGAYHRYRVLPALAHDAREAERFAVTLKRELAVFAVVVLLGGLLAYVPPSMAAMHASSSHASTP